MGWQTRSLPGASGYRPSPKWVIDEELRTSLAISVWGGSSAAVSEDEFFKNLRRANAPAVPPAPAADPDSDPDATRIRAPVPAPRPSLSAEPPTAARLGLAMQAWGEKIAKTENETRWQVAVEAVALRRQESLLQWSWAGEFSLLVSTSRGTELLAHQRASRQPGQQSPLPTSGLGLETGSALVQGETILAPDTRLLLLYSSALPGTLLQGSLPSFQEILRILSEEAADVPHWIALFEP